MQKDRMGEAMLYRSIVFAVLLMLPCVGRGAVLFSDDFEDGADSSWIIPNGGWEIQDGAFYNFQTSGFQQTMSPIFNGSSTMTASHWYFEFTPTVAQNSNAPCVYILIHMSGHQLPYFGTSGYLLDLGYQSHGLISRIDGGVGSILENVQAPAFDFEIGTSYCVEIESDQDAIRVKAYPKGTVAPDWQVEAQDSTYRAGYFGFTTWHTLGLLDNVLVTDSALAEPNTHSLNFDGIDDYVSITSSSLVCGDQLSVAVWYYLDGASVETMLLVSTGNQNDYHIAVSEERRVISGIHSGSTHYQVTSDTVLEDAGWYHIALVYDGASVKQYIGGVLDGEMAASGDVYSPQADNLAFGSYNYFGNPQWFVRGKLDDVSIWNIALTNSEVQSLMSTSPPIPSEGLLGYWNFNEGVGSTAYDLSGNGHHGTIYGATWSTDVPPYTIPEVSDMSFSDVFSEAGFSDWTYVNQAIVIDYNEDGWDDLFFSRRDGMLPRLFLNNQMGGFVESNSELGPLQNLFLEFVAFGDVNNDGDRDIALLRDDGSFQLWHSDAGALVEDTPTAFSGMAYRWVGLLDSDLDGDLDIIGAVNDPQRSLYLYVNDSEVFDPMLLDVDADRVTIADLDLNGFPDILVTHATPPYVPWASHSVLVNQGENTFSNDPDTGLPPLPKYAPCVFDFDNDGDLDIYNGTPDWGNPSHPWLFRNEGSWNFTDVSTASMDIGQHYYAAAIAGDPDRDGDLDYYNTIGAWTDAQYFENQGGGNFVCQSAAYGLNVGGGNTTTTGVWIDYDKDNDLDLFVTNTWNANGGWLFRNDVTTGNWLKVLPVASESNRSLFGTKVAVYWDGKAQLQHYENNLSWYPDSYSATKFFGLGESASADSVVVYWASGQISRLLDVSAGQVVQIEEQYLTIPYWENFDDGIADDFVAESGDWSVIDGAYHCLNEETGTKKLATIGSASWTDYHASVLMRAEGAPIQEFMFRYQDEGNWYLFVVLPDPYNRAEVWKCIDGTQYRLFRLTDFYNEAGVNHRLSVAVEGNQISGYFDNDSIFELTDYDDPLLNGKIALSCYADPVAGWHEVWFDSFAIIPVDMPVGAPELPAAELMVKAYPNPFNPRTTIEFSLPRSAETYLRIYDVSGRLVRDLLNGQVMDANRHRVIWDGLDGSAQRTASGTYFYRLQSGAESRVGKLTLIK